MVLSKKVGGRFIATCGLGGPQYGEEQTAGNSLPCSVVRSAVDGLLGLSMDRVAWLFTRCLNDR